MIEDEGELDRRDVKRYERMPDGFMVSIPEEDDFDLLNEFEKRRYLRIKEKEQRRQQAEEKARKLRRDKLRHEILSDGQAVVKQMTHQFVQIQQILCPFEIKRKCINDLISAFQNLRSSSYNEQNDYNLLFHLPVAIRVLRIVRPLPRYQKSHAIRNRTLIMEQIRRQGKQLDWPADAASTERGSGGSGGGDMNTGEDVEIPVASVQRIIEVKALRVMELSLRRFVAIPMFRANLWRLKRDQTRRARAKLDVIVGRLEQCRLMGVCRSPFHLRASGCPACRVIHMGPVTDVQQYVRSAHVDTGAETLIKLAYEVDGLRAALARQHTLLADVAADLAAFEAALLAQVTAAVQQWYCVYRARRQGARREQALAKSLYYYRIRRLSLLKRELDGVDPFSVDKRPLLYRWVGAVGWRWLLVTLGLVCSCRFHPLTLSSQPDHTPHPIPRAWCLTPLSIPLPTTTPLFHPTTHCHPPPSTDTPNSSPSCTSTSTASPPPRQPPWTAWRASWCASCDCGSSSAAASKPCRTTRPCGTRRTRGGGRRSR